MALVNHSKKEINAKIVYYGPENAGKTASLRYVYDRIKPPLRGELRTIPACGSPLFFFDFSPFEQPAFGDYQLRFHLYTLQGLVENPAAWKMVLKGADGVVIVGNDSPRGMYDLRQSVVQLRDILGSYGIGLDGLPHVLQVNSRGSEMQPDGGDMPGQIGLGACPVRRASPENGKGVLEALTALSRQVMERMAQHVAGAEEARPDETEDATAREPGMVAIAGNEEITPDMDIIAPSGRRAMVTVASGEICVSDGKVNIPLDFVAPGGVRQRLLVSVSVTVDN